MKMTDSCTSSSSEYSINSFLSCPSPTMRNLKWLSLPSSFKYLTASNNMRWFFTCVNLPMFPTSKVSWESLTRYFPLIFFPLLSDFIKFDRSSPNGMILTFSGLAIRNLRQISPCCRGLITMILSVNFAKNLSI